MGCDKRLYLSNMFIYISIHAPVWGATAFTSMYGIPLYISIHAPVWGATTRAGGGSYDIIISIHAPVWGATERLYKRFNCVSISIHAPVWGATGWIQEFPVNFVDFNPRTRMGCDTTNASSGTFLAISIHAPVWGATRVPMLFVRQLIFQSTHPYGVRLDGGAKFD